MISWEGSVVLKNSLLYKASFRSSIALIVPLDTVNPGISFVKSNKEFFYGRYYIIYTSFKIFILSSIKGISSLILLIKWFSADLDIFLFDPSKDIMSCFPKNLSNVNWKQLFFLSINTSNSTFSLSFASTLISATCAVVSVKRVLS